MPEITKIILFLPKLDSGARHIILFVHSRHIISVTTTAVATAKVLQLLLLLLLLLLVVVL